MYMDFDKVLLLDDKDPLFDYLYDRWYSYHIHSINGYEDLRRREFAIGALKERDDFVSTFKRDTKWSYYWYDCIMNDFYGDFK